MLRTAKQTSAPKRETEVKFCPVPTVNMGKIGTRTEQGKTGLLGGEAGWSRLPPGATSLEPFPLRNPEIA